MKKSGYQIVNEIEGQYNVDLIRYKKFPVWLLIRNNVYFKLTQGSNSKVVLSRKEKLIVLGNIILHFLNFFRKSNAWFFGSSTDRILIDNQFFDKYIDFPASMIKKSLVIETPLYKHYKKSKSYSHRIASKGFLILLEQIFIKVFLRSNKIQNEGILKEILDKYEVDIDFKFISKKMVAQYKIMQLILKFNRPKYVFFGTSYINYGYIKAFRENGVKVFEIQHGVINKEHFGYYLKAKFKESYFPDKLLTFGKRELEVFQDKNNKGIKPINIIPTGNFYLEYISKNFEIDDNLRLYTNCYKKVFSVSLQDCLIGEQLIPTILNLSEKLTDCLFLIKRRNKSLDYYLRKYKFKSNVLFVENLNVYQVILHSNLHITAYSSCALEAPALGVMNLLVNIENKSKLYYESILTTETSIFIENDIDKLTNFLAEFKPFFISSQQIKKSHSNVIEPNYILNFNFFLDENIDSKFTI